MRYFYENVACLIKYQDESYFEFRAEHFCELSSQDKASFGAKIESF